jgi:hypothetical protein
MKIFAPKSSEASHRPGVRKIGAGKCSEEAFETGFHFLPQFF